MGFRILGTGSALPERAVSNDELSAFLDTSDAWIRPRTGIASRRLCTTETLDDLARDASLAALEVAGVSPEELDLIVCSTTSADHLMPAQACVIAQSLGTTCPAFDVSAACAGFVFALDVADGWFARGRARRVLVVAAEKMSRLMDWSDRSTCVLFGDGAAAAVLADGESNPLALRLATEPCAEALHVPGLAGTSPFDQTERRSSTLRMEGRHIFKFGVATICSSVADLCEDAGVSIDQVDRFIFHQANERIIAAAVSRLGIGDERVAHTLAQTGNVSSACIPLALDRLARAGELHAGDLVALVGFGAGLDTGACLMRWG